MLNSIINLLITKFKSKELSSEYLGFFFYIHLKKKKGIKK